MYLLCGGLVCIDLSGYVARCIQFACNSAGTEELPDDMHVSKHVGAAEYNDKLLKNQCMCWLFINIYVYTFSASLILFTFHSCLINHFQLFVFSMSF
jgi:hypothetical protein